MDLDVNVYSSIAISQSHTQTAPGLVLPLGTDPLNAPDHALSHRIFAHTANAPEGSVAVDDNGVVTIQEGLNADVTGKINNVTPTRQSVGFTITGGVTPHTLTVPLDASVTGTNTGDQTLVGLGGEAVINKVTSVSGASTDVQYPSAKLLYDQLATKQATLVSNGNIKTVDGQTLLGSGDIPVQNIDWKGAWSAITPYIINDGVSWNGSSYICILASTGDLPSNLTYWNLLAQQGDPGIAGVSGAFEEPFTTTASITVTHNFNAYPVVQFIDDSFNVLIPLSIVHTNTMKLVVTLSVASSGTVICTIGGVNTTVVTKSGNYDILPTDNLILVTAAATMTLPATGGLQGKTYYIKDMATNGVAVVVDTTGGKTIDGQSSLTLIAKYTTLTVFTDGSNWFII